MGIYSYAQRSAGRFGEPSLISELVQATPTIFPQSPGSLDWLLGPALQEMAQSEDAFQLATFAPQGAKDLPVMVFLPGGGFVSGAGTVRWYDAQNFADEQQCLVVVVNYRVGLLAHQHCVGGGNLPVQELLLALAWVQEHVATLGGNPQDVTLAGQSAGAFWAFVLAQLDQARGLFQRVYLGSLSYQPPMSQAQAQERNAVIAQTLGGKSLAEASTEELLATGTALAKAWAGRGLGLYPSADDAVPADLFVVSRAATRLHVDQLLLSYTGDEASAFIGMAPEQAFSLQSVRDFIGANFSEPQQVFESLQADAPDASAKTLMVKAMTLHQIQLYAAEFADAAAASGAQVQLLSFEVSSKLPHAGSAHCFDLPFLFNNRDHWHDAPMLNDLDESSFSIAATVFSGALGAFVRQGIASGSDDQPLDLHRQGATTAYAINESGLDSSGIDRRFAAKRQVLI